MSGLGVIWPVAMFKSKAFCFYSFQVLPTDTQIFPNIGPETTNQQPSLCPAIFAVAFLRFLALLARSLRLVQWLLGIRDQLGYMIYIQNYTNTETLNIPSANLVMWGKTIINHPWLGMVNIPSIKMVIWGMVYGIVLPTLYQLKLFFSEQVWDNHLAVGSLEGK